MRKKSELFSRYIYIYIYIYISYIYNQHLFEAQKTADLVSKSLINAMLTSHARCYINIISTPYC